ncbi:heavy metal translocating P-type ATPase [Clostridioides difficile]|uniref:heavy metal translocating P-type ATPase n=1 Tax=Clostridioides difficile TaxID=1496 RepID=UPI0035582235
MEANNLIKKEFILGGLNCAHCAEEINNKVSKLQEVKSSNLNFINKKLTVNIKESFNEDTTIEKIIDIIDSTEPGLDIQISSKENASSKISIKKELILGGLNCAHCAEEINNKVSKLKEVESSNLNFVNKKLTVNISNNFEADDVINKIKEIINSTEPGLDIQVESTNKVKGRTTEKPGAVNDTNKKELIPLIIGALVYIFGIYQTATGYESQFSNIVFIVAYVIVGGDVLLRAIRNISKGRVFDENFLMALATVGALAIGELSEAVGVMLFYKVGEYLQGVAVGKSRKSITSLMQIRPDYANLKVNSEVKVVSPEEVNVGDIIVVKPGEKVPLDGVVVDGISMLDTSALTGESVLREVEKGDEILSGVINKNALLSIEVTKSFGESTVSKILDLVENSSIKKSKTENFISKFSRYYTPIVVIAALLIAFVPPLVISGEVFSDWLYRGLIFLVVSCPCALVLSIPLSFFSGIGFASKNGILIKGSNYLEALRSVDTVVFDKTGTLTKGVFNVTKLNPEGISEEELLEYAAIAEVNSNHPIAKSILSYYNKKIDLDTIDSYEEIAAYGIRVKHNGNFILAGNEKLMKKENISYSSAKEVGTVVYIAVDKVYRGYIVISDEVKEDSKNAIRSLKAIGVKEVVMLTGVV